MLSARRASPSAARAISSSACSSASIGVTAASLLFERAIDAPCADPASVSARSTYTRARDSNALFSSNDGFSVVAPMNTSVPSSTHGRNASCCALLKRCTSSRNSTVRRPDSLRAVCARSAAARMSFTPAMTADNAMNSASQRLRDQPRERRLAGAGRTPQDHRMQMPAFEHAAQRLAAPEQVSSARRTHRATPAACDRRADAHPAQLDRRLHAASSRPRRAAPSRRATPARASVRMTMPMLLAITSRKSACATDMHRALRPFDHDAHHEQRRRRSSDSASADRCRRTTAPARSSRRRARPCR